jgi:tetratricopeptide (TPR) repeat protein
MGFRFWRRVRIAKGVTLNLSKTGISTSFGPRGAKYTIGRHGQRATVGLPGTGLFYTKKIGSSSAGSRSRSGRGGGRTQAAAGNPVDRLTPGFFTRLMTPDDELMLVEGLKAYVQQRKRAAYQAFQQSQHLADGAFLCGYLALDFKELEVAEKAFQRAVDNHANLGKYISKYGLNFRVTLNVTDQLFVELGLDRRGALLSLVEVWQRLDKPQQAVDALMTLRKLTPNDVLVQLSLAELLVETDATDREYAEYVVKMAADVDNESEVHAALLLYKGRALRTLGMESAARDCFTAGLRRRKDRSDELLNALRYERALTYEALGQKSRARSELERLYAADPDYEDVADRLLD